VIAPEGEGLQKEEHGCPLLRMKSTMTHPFARLTPSNAVISLILFSFLVRVLFAVSIGLGIDESYMVAAGRGIQISYFDHPPIAWWLSWGAAHLAGSEAPIVVRLPFIVLFAFSTWVMFRLTGYLFSDRAGLWAAIAFNLSPVIGITSASWVLPDGPLICALLLSAYCLARGVFDQTGSTTRWWVSCGACAGVALLSKYSAMLSLAGAGLFLITAPAGRRWLAKPQPYIAAAVALLLFLPVILWNAEHHWASFSFQGERAAGTRFHPWNPLITLAGEALFLLPWIWLLLFAEFVKTVCGGPKDERRWLLCCLAAGAVLLFVLISAWSSQRILFHWATPGYLMLFPLAGDWLAHQKIIRASWLRVGLIATLTVVLAGVSIVATEINFHWIPSVVGDFKKTTDHESDAIDWWSLRPQLVERGLLERGNLFVGATNWHNAGKIDYALGGAVPVVCLGSDPRQYGLTHPLAAQLGLDALILDQHMTLESVQDAYGARFDSVEELPPLQVMHAGRVALRFNLFLAHRLH
jgi:4-amino-4-deoxy-L-arabinose transferase-like glycosyltransferase